MLSRIIGPNVQIISEERRSKFTRISCLVLSVPLVYLGSMIFFLS
jgi:hypothetical protein